jgi:hypothetical protein
MLHFFRKKCHRAKKNAIIGRFFSRSYYFCFRYVSINNSFKSVCDTHAAAGTDSSGSDAVPSA